MQPEEASMTHPESSLSRREFAASLGGVRSPRVCSAPILPRPGWARRWSSECSWRCLPRPGLTRHLDVAKEKAEVEATLAGVEKKHAGVVRFTGGDLVRTPEAAQAFAKGLASDVDGVLIVDLTSGTSGMLAPLREIAVPTLYYSSPVRAGPMWTWSGGRNKARRPTSSPAAISANWMRYVTFVRHHTLHAQQQGDAGGARAAPQARR